MPTCPHCDKGRVEALLPRYAPDVPIDERTPTRTIPCPTCDGFGEVTQVRIDCIEAGARLRKLRIERGVGLREAGQLLGHDYFRAELGELSLYQTSLYRSRLEEKTKLHSSPEK
jgi:hypothetical protein